MTWVGQLIFDVSQMRRGGLYPGAPKKGTRTEQALSIAFAEMYVQGASTRKVTDILVKLPGPEVSISRPRVSCGAEQLDAGLSVRRKPRLDETPHVFLGAPTSGYVQVAPGRLRGAGGGRHLAGRSSPRAMSNWRSMAVRPISAARPCWILRRHVPKILPPMATPMSRCSLPRMGSASFANIPNWTATSVPR